MLSIAAVGCRLGSRAPRAGIVSRSIGQENSTLTPSMPSSKRISGQYMCNNTASTQSVGARWMTTMQLEPLVPAEPKIVPSSFVVPVVNLATGETTESVELKAGIFGVKVRTDLLHQMVVWHLANRRAGNASTKGRGEVAGSTRKIFKQKGTGNARMGSVRSTQRKGSGAAHGPHPKDWSYKINKKVRKLALMSALASKFAKGELMIVDGLTQVEPKTKTAQNLSSKFNWEDGGALIISGQNTPDNFKLAMRNIHYIDVAPNSGLSVYHVLRRKHLVISKDTLFDLDKHVLL